MRTALLVSLTLLSACGGKQPEPASAVAASDAGAGDAAASRATASDAAAPQATAADAAAPANAVPGEVVVILEKGVEAPTQVGEDRCEVVNRAAAHIVLLRCQPGDPKLLDRLRALPGVRSAEPNRMRQPR